MSIGTAVLTVFFNRTAIAAVESSLGVYLILSISEFLLRLAAMPGKIDREQRQEIARLTDSQQPRFRSMIQKMSIYEHHATTPFAGEATPAMAKLNIGMQLQIRSLGAPPTTMHDFTLHLLGERSMTLPDGGRMRVETGALAERSFHYDTDLIGGEQSVRIRSDSEWKMTFKDTHDNEYETPVFKYNG